MPLSEAAGPDCGIWPAGSLVKCTPTWISVNLVWWECRQMISVPSMKSTWQWIFSFLEVTTWRTWREKVVTTSLIWRWGYWPYLSQASMIAGSSGARDYGCPHGRWIVRLLLLIICLESLDSISGPSIAAWIRRNHWGSNWAPRSSTRTAEGTSEVNDSDSNEKAEQKKMFFKSHCTNMYCKLKCF